ncbi:hypothetical protein [Nocardiopsis baichengensis]|uniref:hypothetical protein n=1 Tax=Nocardiopsis baichengensis TaxID=280240 RepID=UPI001EF9F3C9|nr:hypothetical protein [Nocardiopsis baichengensis]
MIPGSSVLRPELLLLAGSALNAAAVPPGFDPPRGAALELRSRGTTVRLPADVYPASEGRWGVRATAALVAPDAQGAPVPSDLAAVRLEPGVWTVRFIVYGRLGSRAFCLQAPDDVRPTEAPGLALEAGPGGRATVRIGPPAPAARVEQVHVRPHGVRVEGLLQGLEGEPACLLRARRHRTELPVHPDRRPDPRGTAFALDLPLERMARSCGGTDEVRWVVRFRPASGADLTVGLPRTDLERPRAALPVPDATVRTGRGAPPLRVRVFHDGPLPGGGTALVAGVRPLPAPAPPGGDA